MAKKRRGFARAVEYDLDEALEALADARPRRIENKLVMVPSLKFLGRSQPEDIPEDCISYRIPDEFVEWVFPEDAPLAEYPFVNDPVFGFTCGEIANPRYLELEAMMENAKEIFYDELGFEEMGTSAATRSGFQAIYDKLSGLDKLGRPKPLLVRFNDDDDFAEVTYRYLDKMIGASERFLWSYAANFRKLILPHIMDVITLEPTVLPVSRYLAGGRGRVLNTLALRDKDSLKVLISAVARPGYLAMLYAFKAATEAERDGVLDQMMDPQQVNRLTVGKRLVAGNWVGSGSETAQPYSGAADEVLALIATNMLVTDGENGLKLTAGAEKLLGVLPPECDDPDWKIARFQPNGFIEQALSSSADDWVMSFFHKVKAALYPASD
jgi:hypothetical protein